MCRVNATQVSFHSARVSGLLVVRETWSFTLHRTEKGIQGVRTALLQQNVSSIEQEGNFFSEPAVLIKYKLQMTQMLNKTE